MHKKLLLIVLFFVIAISLIQHCQKREESNLIFSDVKNIYDINRIEVSAKDLNLTLHPKNNLWRIKEKEDYYANYLLMSELFDSFKYARLAQEIDVPDFEGVTLKIIDNNENVLLNAVFKENLIKINGKKYMALDILELPEDLVSWFEQPFLEINPDDIESGAKIPNYIYFEDVTKEKPQAEPQSFEITMKNGLIIYLELYKSGDDYWISQKLSTTKLPTGGANDYINSRDFLYEGWYFKIPVKYGLALESGND